MSKHDIAVRYRTAGGAIATVYGEYFEYKAVCSGCRELTYSGDLRAWAKKHASQCLAMPLPR